MKRNGFRLAPATWCKERTRSLPGQIQEFAFEILRPVLEPDEQRDEEGREMLPERLPFHPFRRLLLEHPHGLADQIETQGEAECGALEPVSRRHE